MIITHLFMRRTEGRDPDGREYNTTSLCRGGMYSWDRESLVNYLASSDEGAYVTCLECLGSKIDVDRLFEIGYVVVPGVLK
jgi:hypothetical protein